MKGLFDVLLILLLSYFFHYFSGEGIYFSFVFVGVFVCVGKLAYLQSKIDKIES